MCKLCDAKALIVGFMYEVVEKEMLDSNKGTKKPKPDEEVKAAAKNLCEIAAHSGIDHALEYVQNNLNLIENISNPESLTSKDMETLLRVAKDSGVSKQEAEETVGSIALMKELKVLLNTMQKNTKKQPLVN